MLWDFDAQPDGSEQAEKFRDTKRGVSGEILPEIDQRTPRVRLWPLFQLQVLGVDC
jgi:hypothetical protein